MIRYLIAAFLARPGIPGFGNLPLNLMAVVGFGLLGLVTNNPGWWLLGTGLEAAYLAMLVNNQRFRNIIDARAAAGGAAGRPVAGPVPVADIVRELSPGGRTELARLDEKMERILALYAQFGVDDFLASSNRESMATLRGHFLKLLRAEESIETHWSGDPQTLKREIATLEEGLKGEGMTEELRSSRLRTLEIYQQRLENQSRKESMLDEIASELKRIEAQFDLALENAAMSSQPSSISAELAFDLSGMDQRLLSAPAAAEKAPAAPRKREREREAS